MSHIRIWRSDDGTIYFGGKIDKIAPLVTGTFTVGDQATHAAGWLYSAFKNLAASTKPSTEGQEDE